jgi:hypothetical protein
MVVGARAGRVAVVALIAGQGLLGAAMPAHANPIADRYASPTGATSGACTKAAPCEIETAVDSAPAGATVIVEPGSYGTAVAPLTDELQDDGGAITVRGTSATQPPVIYSAAPHYAFDFVDASSLSNLEIHSSGTRAAFILFSPASHADHIRAFSSAGQSGACAVDGTLTDSLCVNTAEGSPAVRVQDSTGENTATIRGVTGVATGIGGVGLLDLSGSPDTETVDATNSIFIGKGEDISDVTQPGATAAINLTNCDYSSFSSFDSPGTNDLTSVAGDISAAPKFVSPSTDDFREQAASPTVNAGATDPTGTDVAGNPRTLGSAPDMGAYELLPKPVTKAPTVASRTKTGARVAVSVNPEGLATSVYAIARHGRTQTRSRVVSAHSGRKATAVHLVLTGLTPGTTYSVRAVATNAAGRTTSTTTRVTTPRR